MFLNRLWTAFLGSSGRLRRSVCRVEVQACDVQDKDSAVSATVVCRSAGAVTTASADRRSICVSRQCGLNSAVPALSVTGGQGMSEYCELREPDNSQRDRLKGCAMARVARSEIFEPDEVAIVHVMNRTVRGCFLLGNDLATGRNYDHRKDWMDQQLTTQAQYFAIDLLTQSILDNHFHLVLRSRPDMVREWDDEEVARRWLMICPSQRDDLGLPVPPTPREFKKLLKDKKKLADVRTRLSDISWWMKLLTQNIAQRANKEEGQAGSFWQGRFKAVRILDEATLLACCVYVDLNPIRAAMAETIEGSRYSAVQKRFLDQQDELEVQRSVQAAQREATEQEFRAAVDTAVEASPEEQWQLEQTLQAEACVIGPAAARTTGARRRSRHLAPIELREGPGAETGTCPNLNGDRCSDKGFLSMTTAEYLSLVDWTARTLDPKKRGATPNHIAPLFERLGITEEVWCAIARNFRKLFSVVAGKPQAIDNHRSSGRKRRYYVPPQTLDLMARV